MTSNIQLRDYQETAVAEIRAEFRAKNMPVLFVLPTGGGKTYTFSYVAANAADKGNTVCIIVHRKELLLQASASLSALGIEHGLISPFFTPKPRARVQVASVDTLLQRIKRWQKQCEVAAAAGKPLPPCPYQFKLLIYDEAHHVVDGNKWGRAFDLLGRPAMLGVTATPVRTDGKGLGEHAGGVFKAMVIGPSVRELIARGSLLNPIVYTSLEAPETDDLKTNRDGSDNLKAMADRIDKPKITGDAVKHYAEICPGARAIVFCCNIQHAKHVVDEFNARGFRFELLVGAPEMSDTERTEVNLKLRRGEIHGAVTVDLVSEGYDLPDLECCIMLRATASEALFLQQVGRVMRPSPGKTTCWLLDHVANVGRMKDGEFKRKHGLPDEVREWTLDGRKKRKGKKKEEEDDKVELLQCPECYVVHEPAPSCPKCGHVYPVKTGGRSIEQVDGTLTKITPEMEEMMREEERKRQRSAQAAAKSVDDMMQQLGYSRTRAEAIVKAREEKAAIRTSLIFDMQAWHKKTGQSPYDTFGIYLSDLKAYKPKALKELRERFDKHCADYASTDAVFGGMSQPSGQEPAF